MLVYVCSSLKPHTIRRVDKILDRFKAQDQDLKLFRPYGTNPKKMMETVREDIDAIERCDELWVLGRFGRDCSFEIGYALALKKKVIIWEDHTNRQKLWSDWMWRIGKEKGLLEVKKL